MAVERIDPFQSEDPHAVDHMLRYYWAAKYVPRKTVLDAACGTGFGCAILLHHDAASVTGIDASSQTIDNCRESWKQPGLHFESIPIENADEALTDSFDIVTCFETLEHTHDPARAVTSLKNTLNAEGILFGSVPAECDLTANNPYHLHHFSIESLESLLKANFRHFRIYRQEFQVRSELYALPQNEPAKPVQTAKSESLQIQLGYRDNTSDSFVFAASDATLPALESSFSAHSRMAWLISHDLSAQAFRSLKNLTESHRKLFHQYGMLQIEFANLLGWAQYHYEVSTGNKPAGSDLERVRKTISEREDALRTELQSLSDQNDLLKAQLQQAEQQISMLTDQRRTAFTAQ